MQPMPLTHGTGCLAQRPKTPKIQAMYAREELGSWPRPAHVGVLVALIQSRDPERLSVLNHILQCRRQRFGSGNDDVFEDTDADRVHASRPLEERDERFALMAVSRVCEVHDLPSGMDEHVSSYLIGDPTRLYSQKEATKRGLVHWLMRYSSNPSADIEKIVICGHFDCARFMHDRLKKEGRLRCSTLFLNLVIVRGDRRLVWWHMQSCDAHSALDWVYAAIWVGRGDILKLTTKK